MNINAKNVFKMRTGKRIGKLIHFHYHNFFKSRSTAFLISETFSLIIIAIFYSVAVEYESNFIKNYHCSLLKILFCFVLYAVTAQINFDFAYNM